jgi:two-component system, NarL family, response regulator NreC
MTTRILLVDDHAVVRSGLRMLLENERDIEIIGEASSAQGAIESAMELKPNVILMDIGLPDLSGIDATREIKKRVPDASIVALTIHEDEEYFFKMLEAGATGYVPKRAAPEELLTAIRAAATGQVYLYPSLAKLLVRDFLSGGRPSSESSPIPRSRTANRKCLPISPKAPTMKRSQQRWSFHPRPWHAIAKTSCAS